MQGADAVEFTLRDGRGALRGVRLIQEVGLPEPLDFDRDGAAWRLEVARPDVDRMEYLLEIVDRRGRRSTVLDPANPIRVGGAFGDKSVREFPEYTPPRWLDVPPVRAGERAMRVTADELGDAVELALWTPDGLDDDAAAPLVVVHDGPEFASLGGITRYLGAAIAVGDLPPVRAALLEPGDRNAWYAADPAYADALCDEVVAAVTDEVSTRGIVGVGASLGGLAMLHAHRCHPGTFDALLLQSGSFFLRAFDEHEDAFPGFAAIADFVASVADAERDDAPVPVVLTCGTVEENLANNREMASHLRRLGYPAELRVVRDAHNYTAWRDALHPSLAHLVTAAAERTRAA